MRGKSTERTETPELHRKFVPKLPNKRVDGLVSGGIGERFNLGHGRLMKEWIAIGAKTDSWVELAKEAYEFVKEGTT
jgi:hypothetical protein